jgi:hypothetical protein
MPASAVDVEVYEPRHYKARRAWSWAESLDSVTVKHEGA